MRHVSALFRQTMEERRDFYASANITFADGAKMTLEKRDFTLSGNTITESAESTSFPLGILAGRRITITLENGDDRWSKYDFFGARIALKTCFDLPDGTTESLNIGTFTVISPESYGETVSITAMDGSYKTDKPYTTAQAYPMTAGVALRDACQTCDIDLATPSFSNDDFLIQQAPKDITFRQYIGCIAMLAGGNAVMDEFDRLTIKSYDFTPFERFGESYNGGVFDVLSEERYMTGDTASGGSFNPWDTGDAINGGAFGDRDDIHVLYQFSGVPVVEADDVVITGIQFMSEDEEGNQTAHLYGTDGYVLALDNPLVAGQEGSAAALIGAKIVGLRFRPFSGNHIALPTAQFMDLAWILDRKDNGHQSVITDVDFTYFGYTVLKCSADSPIRNSSTYYGQATKAVVQARQMVEKERTDRQKALDTLAQELAQSSGLYMTQEVQSDKSIIYYMHDKPTLKDSAIVWKLTANALGISTDGGESYPYGLDVTGTAILNRIYTIGLDADYIKTGRLEVYDKSKKLMFLVDCDTGEVQIVAKSFSLSNGSTIESIAEGEASSAANDALSSAKGYTDKTATSTLSSAKSYADTAATNAVSGQTQTDILNKLTNGGLDKGIYLQNGKLYISFNAAQGGELTLGGLNNGNGVLRALNSSGEQYFTLDNTGFLLTARFLGLLNPLYIDMRPTIFSGISLRANEDFTGNTNSISEDKIVIIENNDGDTVGITHPNSTKVAVNWIETCGPNYKIGSQDYSYMSSERIATTGVKSRVVVTPDYGSRLQYCYEMPSPMFGDIGEGETDEDGNCYVFLDDIFAETVNADCRYQVFLQKEGPGDLWVSQKEQTYFVVSGTPNLAFSWEVKVKQRDYEMERLEQFEPPAKDKEPDYINQAASMVKNLYEEWEDTYNEKDNQLYALGNRRG